MKDLWSSRPNGEPTRHRARYALSPTLRSTWDTPRFCRRSRPHVHPATRGPATCSLPSTANDGGVFRSRSARAPASPLATHRSRASIPRSPRRPPSHLARTQRCAGCCEHEPTRIDGAIFWSAPARRERALVRIETRTRLSMTTPREARSPGTQVLLELLAIDHPQRRRRNATSRSVEALDRDRHLPPLTRFPPPVGSLREQRAHVRTLAGQIAFDRSLRSPRSQGTTLLTRSRIITRLGRDPLGPQTTGPIGRSCLGTHYFQRYGHASPTTRRREAKRRPRPQRLPLRRKRSLA